MSSPPSPVSSNGNTEDHKNSKKPRQRAPRKRARIRCGDCEACKREDCGTCLRCLKKKKFGGDGTCKEACIHRKCTNLKDRGSPPPKKAHKPDDANVQNNESPRGGDVWRQVNEKALMSRSSSRRASSSRKVSRKALPLSDSDCCIDDGYNDDHVEDDDDDDDEDGEDDDGDSLQGKHEEATPRPSSRRSSSSRKSVLETSLPEPVYSVGVKPATASCNNTKRSGRKSHATTANSKTKRKRSSPGADPKSTSKGAMNGNNLPYLYGRPAPAPVIEMCAGCNGERTEELKGEPILLCDGCDREFHLDCCIPTLEEVPKGTYFCLDCSPKGSTACLAEYFDTHHEVRADFATSYDFVESTLAERLRDAALGDESDDEIRAPMSELTRVSKLHREALRFSNRYIALKNPSAQSAKAMKKASSVSSKTSPKNSSISPRFFVGKCIRLYCPTDNQYHSGRILDVRPATHTDKFWESEVAGFEYFVRFPAGKDYRKESYHQWLILEEHSIAVASTLIWCMNILRRGLHEWKPGQTWLRTSLELVPMQAVLSEADHQIYRVGSDPPKPDHTPWALVSYYGGDQHELLELSTEAVDFFDLAFAEARHQRDLASSDLDVRMSIYIGQALVEWEEQKRVRSWQIMKLTDPMHPRALVLRDESALEPCMQRERDDRLCPSIQIDFDRTFLLGTMKGKEPTKDAAASLVCELVSPSPMIMQQL